LKTASAGEGRKALVDGRGCGPSLHALAVAAMRLRCAPSVRGQSGAHASADGAPHSTAAALAF
jgi:hypothetical protein